MVDHIDKSGVLLSWDPPRNDGGSKIQGYIIEKRTPFSPRWTRINRQPIRGTDSRVTDLYKGDDYEFRVVAVSEAGMGKPSDMTPPVAIKDPFGKFIHVSIIPQCNTLMMRTNEFLRFYTLGFYLK